MERFNAILGQDGPKRLLSNFLNTSRIPNTLLFSGPPGVGKLSTALIFASLLNDEEKKIMRNIHPDVRVLFPEFKGVEPEEIFKMRKKGLYYRLRHKNGNVLIDTIREIKRLSSLTPFEGKWKIFIIAQSERMTEEAKNSFLKLLEEPAEDTLFILITTSEENLSETIRSRGMVIRFRPLRAEEIISIAKELGVELKKEEIFTSQGIEESIFRKNSIDLIEKLNKLFFNTPSYERMSRIEEFNDTEVENILKILDILLFHKMKKIGLERTLHIIDKIKNASEYIRSNIKQDRIMRYLFMEV